MNKSTGNSLLKFCNILFSYQAVKYFYVIFSLDIKLHFRSLLFVKMLHEHTNIFSEESIEIFF